MFNTLHQNVFSLKFIFTLSSSYQGLIQDFLEGEAATIRSAVFGDAEERLSFEKANLSFEADLRTFLALFVFSDGLPLAY